MKYKANLKKPSHLRNHHSVCPQETEVAKSLNRVLAFCSQIWEPARTGVLIVWTPIRLHGRTGVCVWAALLQRLIQ